MGKITSKAINPAGYSGTPLAKKLGIKAGYKVLLYRSPDNYETLLDDLPDGVVFASRLSKEIDLVHLFESSKALLKNRLKKLRGSLSPEAAVWVSWPKKASKVPTTITEDTVRELALPLGYVDIKVCAVDDVWSALKLVVRKELRD